VFRFIIAKEDDDNSMGAATMGAVATQGVKDKSKKKDLHQLATLFNKQANNPSSGTDFDVERLLADDSVTPVELEKSANVAGFSDDQAKKLANLKQQKDSLVKELQNQ
jgi:hypothetical protein